MHSGKACVVALRLAELAGEYRPEVGDQVCFRLKTLRRSKAVSAADVALALTGAADGSTLKGFIGTLAFSVAAGTIDLADLSGSHPFLLKFECAA